MNTIARRLRAKLVPTEVIVEDVATIADALIELRCVAPTPLSPGDVVAVRVDGRRRTVGGTWRRYTVADTDDSLFRLIIERNPHGSATDIFDEVRTGSRLVVRGPSAPVLPSPGTAPIVVVGDLTGLATIASVLHTSRCSDPKPCVEAAVITARSDLAPIAIATCLRPTANELTVHHDHDELAEWVRDRYRAHPGGIRCLVVGEHDLTVRVRRSAQTAGAPHGTVRARTYWKPGKRGLE
jgi:NADPH-dependent ferric siderophore reductase